MNVNLEKNINHRLAAVAGQTRRLVFRVIAESGLTITPEQWAVLYYLQKKDGMTMGELAACTKKDLANLTRVVDLLLRDGYVKKVKNPDDKRSCRVFILPKVNDIQDAAQNVYKTMATLTLKGINKNEQKLLLDILARIEGNVTEQLEKRNID